MDSLKHSSGLYDGPLQITRKAFYRGLALDVLPGGVVTIKTGRTTSQKEIRTFIQENKKWILNKIQQYEALATEHPQKYFMQGEYLLFLGKWYMLQLHEEPVSQSSKESFPQTNQNPQWVGSVPQLLGTDQVRVIANTIAVQVQDLVNEKKPEAVKERVLNFYRNFARKYMSQRVQVYAQKMNVKVNKLSFRRQKTCWGSCSEDGNISLNWKLIAAPLDAIDYVIVHELAHLVHQNHSKEFWNLVGEFFPNYKSVRKWLRKNQYEFDFLSKESEIHPAESQKHAEA